MVEDRPTYGGPRTLAEIFRELGSLARQGRVGSFFNSVRNANKLGGLVEDVHKAVIEYQVRSQSERPHLPHT